VRIVRVAVNTIGLVTLLLMVYTSFFHPQDSLTGDSLIRHVSVSPAFAIAAVVVALFWAHRSQFSREDRWLVALRKLFFWIAVALVVPTFVSILAAMFPIAGTAGQNNLAAIHRICGQMLAGASLLFAGFALTAWWTRSEE
jgi:hypothetical protein